MTVSTDIQSQTTETLQGRKAWLITDGKKGMDVQCAGIADALGLDHEFKHVAPTGLRAGLAPWGGVQRRRTRSGRHAAPAASAHARVRSCAWS